MVAVVAATAGEHLDVAKSALWNGMGFVQTKMIHERANLVERLLGLGGWNADC